MGKRTQRDQKYSKLELRDNKIVTCCNLRIAAKTDKELIALNADRLGKTIT